MALIELSTIISLILETVTDAAKKNLKRREIVIDVLKRLGLYDGPLPDDFDAIYACALVEYGIDKPEPILNLFRNEFIRRAFREAFYQNNPSILDKEAEGIVDWNNETGQLGHIDYDLRREFAGFTLVFNHIVDNLRSPSEVKRDYKIDEILSNGQTLLKEFNKLKDQKSEEEKLKNKRKYELRNKHEFEAPRYQYKPIRDTVVEFQEKLEKIKGGYIGVFGPPGSGKSTFLTQTLRTLPVRLIRYYAYVPDAQDPSVLRGESINFYHDMTLSIQFLGIGGKEQPDPTDRMALMQLFNKQLLLLGKDYQETKTKSIILVDGLDHIAREQNPERSLIADLPSPNAIPEGVFIVIGSQTKELPNLPVNIHQTFSQNERVILMGKLTPQNAVEIIHQTLLDIDNKFDGRIYQTVDGHPLSLIYLLSLFSQAESPSDYQVILEKAVPYQGNIEDHYFSHWKTIEDDLELEKFLGLLARIRGPIPMEWVAQWSNEKLLRKLQRTFGHYFSKDNLGRWEFFHNSFRIFLEARTANDLPGRTSVQIDHEFHLQLAHLYEKSTKPYSWETLYHYYKAGDHKRVIEIAQYSWFRPQVEALRPIDAIETDVRLAIKSAGQLLDAVALVRYTLIGASLQQRSNVLADTNLPHLLIEAGKSELAIDYARDGARLRLKEKSAISLARNLYSVNRKEALRIFELAEPLEYLSGQLISERNAHHQDFHELLSEWVKSASLLRSPLETIQFIRRIQIEPAWNDKNKSVAQISLEFQNWLLYTGALSCCERDGWDDWNLYFDSLDKQRDRQTRYFTLLRCIEKLRQDEKNERATQLLLDLLELKELTSYGLGRNKVSNLLSIVEAIYFLEIENYENLANTWFKKIGIVPMSDRESSSLDKSPNLLILHFRYARMRFALYPNINPDQLMKEVEQATTFEEHEDAETRLARRQITLIAYTLAKIWLEGHAKANEPDAFLSRTKWILDLMETSWNTTSATFHLHTEGAKEDISEIIAACALKHGKDTVQAIKNEFTLRWERSPKVWWAGIQRTAVMAMAKRDTDYYWARKQLERIEKCMTQGLDVYGRVKEYEKQSAAWLQIGEKDKAISTLYRLVVCARGIYSDKDYQLVQWANWIRKINFQEPTTSIQRIKKFIRQVFSVEDTASGVDDALLIVIQSVFDCSPVKTIKVYKNFLERKAITHDEGIVRLLISALEVKNPPVLAVYWIMEDLLFPFARTTSAELAKKFFSCVNANLGEKDTRALSNRMVERIQTEVVRNHRTGWLDDVHTALIEIGIKPETLDVQWTNFDIEKASGESSLDKKLNLATGEQLTLRDAISRVATIYDLRLLLKNEENRKGNYFEWHKLAISLFGKVSTIEEITEICTLVESRTGRFYEETNLASVYTGASERLQQLGHFDYSKQYIQKAIKLTNPSGWLAYWDGGVKHKVLQQIIKVMGTDGRNETIKLFAQDISERYRYPEQLINSLDEITQVLFDAVPYVEIWPDIDEYLDELFSGIVADAQPDLEEILELSIEPEPREAINVLSDLLILYLDFPAYPIFYAAIKACSKLVLEGDQTLKSTLRQALQGHDQLALHGLMVLEVAGLQKPSEIIYYKDDVIELQKAPNVFVRIIATRILSIIDGNLLSLPRLEHDLPAIYSIHLPNIAIHHTEDSVIDSEEPILLNDPALTLRPLDTEARKIAGIADVADDNVLYRTVEILKELESSRTWLFNGAALKPHDLSVFLEKTNLMYSHNKPHILPSKNSLARVVAELYDAGRLTNSDLQLIEFIFRDYDPNLFLLEPHPRPSYINGIGGIIDNFDSYIRLPQDWGNTLEDSLSLLKNRSSDGKIILGEWTHLKRLQDEWPSEERMSVSRAVTSYAIWDGVNLSQGSLPLPNKVGLRISDYLRITQFPEQELIVAHNGFDYQMGKANWIGLNPRIGFDLGWQPHDQGVFAWKNKTGQLVAESIFWQDGNPESANRHDHVEVGYGWLVLISEEGYQAIRRRYGVVSRGGIIRRSLGWIGSILRVQASSKLDSL